jgi:uncharacterized membrane protein (DUF485 family)
MNLAQVYRFIDRMNLLTAVFVMFLLHLTFYFLIGEENWLLATVSATATYGLVFALLKDFVRKKRDVR